jgi:2-dehydropantoate 2-reductase
MKTTVFGAGALGCYLAHALIKAGNDVTLVARGVWGETLAREGLAIHHVVQLHTTRDHPRVVPTLADAGAADVLFSVMQQGQMLAALPELAAAEAPLVVLVGNSVHVDEELAYLSEHAPHKTVLFGFQATAGRREKDHVECARAGASGLTVGAAHGEAPELSKAVLNYVFSKGGYKPHYQADMADWLVCHAAAVLPFCYVAYRCECDLTRATKDDLVRLVDATGEAYRVLAKLGYRILPEGEEGFYRPGVQRSLWHAVLQVIAKSSIGRLCVTDHCRAATHEMREVDHDFMALVDALPGRLMPTWDAQRSEMPGWDDLEARWNKKAN